HTCSSAYLVFVCFAQQLPPVSTLFPYTTLFRSGGIIALLLSLMMGDWLARRVLAPVESIVRTAQGITAADDLGRRIPYNGPQDEDRKSTRLNSSHVKISYAVFCLKKKNNK